MCVQGMPRRWWQLAASNWVSRGYLNGAAGPLRVAPGVAAFQVQALLWAAA